MIGNIKKLLSHQNYQNQYVKGYQNQGDISTPNQLRFIGQCWNFIIIQMEVHWGIFEKWIFIFWGFKIVKTINIFPNQNRDILSQKRKLKLNITKI